MPAGVAVQVENGVIQTMASTAAAAAGFRLQPLGGPCSQKVGCIGVDGILAAERRERKRMRRGAASYQLVVGSDHSASASAAARGQRRSSVFHSSAPSLQESTWEP